MLDTQLHAIADRCNCLAHTYPRTGYHEWHSLTCKGHSRGTRSPPHSRHSHLYHRGKGRLGEQRSGDPDNSISRRIEGISR
jgi:hypothetical protein